MCHPEIKVGQVLSPGGFRLPTACFLTFLNWQAG
jgi:hypothetical protein